MKRWVRGIPLVALIVFPGCGEGSDRPGTRDDAPVLSTELLHEIGSIADSDQALTSVGSVVLTDDGRMLIEQSADAQIRVHDADGGLLTLIGRRGQGPGEFGGIGSLGVHGERIWITDGGNDRITWYGLDGTLIDTRRWSPGIVSGESVSYSYGVWSHLLPDQSAISIPLIAVMLPEGGGPAVDVDVPVRRISPTGALTDTVVIYDDEGWLPVPEGRMSIVSASPTVGLDRRGAGVVMVDRAPSGNPEPGTFRVRRIDLEGDTVLNRTFAFDPIPLPADTLEKNLARLPEATRVFARERAWAPDAWPPVTDLALGTDGTIWLRREPVSDSIDWWAIDPDTGDHLGIVRLPPRHEIVESRGDEIVIVRTDEFDVQYVQRRRLKR